MRLVKMLVVAAVLEAAGLAGAHGETARTCEDRIESRLYLGLSRADGGEISRSEVTNFVEQTVAPLFPDGFTLLDGTGYWRNKEIGATVSEKVVVLIVVRPDDIRSSEALGQISDAYIERFHQMSVLRTDAASCMRVLQRDMN